MMHRVLIEFVVDVPNADVARDVETRIGREHIARVCDLIQSVTGFEPLQAPGERGLYTATEEVTWDAREKMWLGSDDNDEGDDDE